MNLTPLTTLAATIFGYEITEEQVTQYTAWGVKIAGVLALLIGAWILAAWIGAVVRKSCTKARLDLTLAKFFGKMAKWTVLIAAVIACLGAFGVQTTSFAALIGAAGLAVGLAFQGTLSNFASGVMLLTFRPFKVGDVVNLAGNVGKVDEIELFTTRMITGDNRLIIIPNTQIFGSTIENITAMPTRRVDVAVGTDYGADIDATRKVLEQVIADYDGKLDDPESVVFLAELGGSSIDWQVRVWAKTDDFWAVRQEITRRVKVALDEAGIGIPFPQQDVHLDQAVIDALASRS